MPSAATLAGLSLLALAAGGIGYTLVATVAVARLRRTPAPPRVSAEPVSLLKPLHGAEPRLSDNLATLLDQDWDAAIELVAGVADPADPALATAHALVAPGPVAGEGTGRERIVRTVADATRHGANAKVSNLVNLSSAAHHDLLVLSDSDIAVPRDYLTRIAAALAAPGVGAVTCLYRGRGDTGFWSVMGAAGVSYGFLPNAAASLMLGDRRLCMGSTIALRRGTLDAIGGFRAFADILADDHAIGAAVRATGASVAVPPFLVLHASTERSLRDLIAHELRWASTVRGVVPRATYLGLALTQPVAPALAACLFAPVAGPVTLALALAARLALWRTIDGWGGRTASPWLLPLRDLMSSAIFVASLFTRSVDWRGERLTMLDQGRIARHPELIE